MARGSDRRGKAETLPKASARTRRMNAGSRRPAGTWRRGAGGAALLLSHVPGRRGETLSFGKGGSTRRIAQGPRGRRGYPGARTDAMRELRFAEEAEPVSPLQALAAGCQGRVSLQEAGAVASEHTCNRYLRSAYREGGLTRARVCALPWKQERGLRQLPGDADARRRSPIPVRRLGNAPSAAPGGSAGRAPARGGQEGEAPGRRRVPKSPDERSGAGRRQGPARARGRCRSCDISQKPHRKLQSHHSINSQGSKKSKGSSKSASSHIPIEAQEDCCVHCILSCLFCEFLTLCNIVLDCATCGSCTSEDSCICCCCCNSGECADCDLPCDMDCGIIDACCESADCLEICMECCGLCFSS
nr:PREDICTED: myoD family inhibitor-like [Apteryx mantelli mantelli]